MQRDLGDGKDSRGMSRLPLSPGYVLATLVRCHANNSPKATNHEPRACARGSMAQPSSLVVGAGDAVEIGAGTVAVEVG